jgi:hypothetical protein
VRSVLATDVISVRVSREGLQEGMRSLHAARFAARSGGAAVREAARKHNQVAYSTTRVADRAFATTGTGSASTSSRTP